MNEVVLEGCTPEPLMGYLKALGVLRLVSEQADPTARGFWRDGVFVLHSKFDESGLTAFFRDDYKPTPLLAPWNAGSGFYVKLNRDRYLNSAGNEIDFKGRGVVAAIDALESSDTTRLTEYRRQICETKRALAGLAEPVDFRAVLAEPLRKWPHAKSKEDRKKVNEQADKILGAMMLFCSGDAVYTIGKAAKDEFISDLRGKVLTDDGLGWLDAALAMRSGSQVNKSGPKKDRVEAPVLGSGGNLGQSELSGRFAEVLVAAIGPEADAAMSTGWLAAALRGDPAPNLPDLGTISADQFDPGRAGGANMGQGLEGGPRVNPWDYVLMTEGAVALAGAATRKLGAGRGGVSFPFQVDSTPAGHGSVGKGGTHGEAWLPLWTSPATHRELKSLFAEGRAEFGRRRARSGLTFAQAVAGLGIDRGIASFVRYEFQQRRGDSYVASPLGLFDVPLNPLDGIELVRLLNPPLSQLRRAAGEKAPARFPAAVRRIEGAIFDFCKYSGGKDRLAAVLAALGAAERELAVGDMRPDKRRARPLGGLSSAWLRAADDGSPEFRLARSLAFLHGGDDGRFALRRYLEPVEPKGTIWEWGDGGGHVVWGGGDLARNLGAVLARRQLDAGKVEGAGHLDGPYRPHLGDLAAFLRGETDDRKLEDLIWGLSLIDSKTVPRRSNTAADARAPHARTGPPTDPPAPLPRVYALLKLTLLPGPLTWSGAPGVEVKPEPAALAGLRAGRVQAACDAAAGRLRASGLSVVGDRLADGSRRFTDWAAGQADPGRLLAALLFPLSARVTDRLADLVLRPTAVSRA